MKSPLGKRIRTVAVGALATAALSIPVLSALGVSAHDAGKSTVSHASHRLALSFNPASIRLT
jgi:hypothetical protein